MGGSDFSGALEDQEEVQIRYVRGKDGKTRTIPIWFTVEGRRLHLLPMYGLKTRWLQDVENSGEFEVRVKGRALKASPSVVRDGAKVGLIREEFARKYGAREVSRYYPTAEVALEVPL